MCSRTVTLLAQDLLEALRLRCLQRNRQTGDLPRKKVLAGRASLPLLKSSLRWFPVQDAPFVGEEGGGQVVTEMRMSLILNCESAKEAS